MKERFKMFRRKGGVFYARDTVTLGKQSLGTIDRVEASRLLAAKNQAIEQPSLNKASRRFIPPLPPPNSPRARGAMSWRNTSRRARIRARPGKSEPSSMTFALMVEVQHKARLSRCM